MGEIFTKSEYIEMLKEEVEKLNNKNEILKAAIFQICEEYKLEQKDYDYYTGLIAG